jgi:hypothetical protein
VVSLLSTLDIPLVDLREYMDSPCGGIHGLTSQSTINKQSGQDITISSYGDVVRCGRLTRRLRNLSLQFPGIMASSLMKYMVDGSIFDKIHFLCSNIRCPVMDNFIAVHTNCMGYGLHELQGALQHHRTNITEWERGLMPAWIEAGELTMFKAWEQRSPELIADRPKTYAIWQNPALIRQ